MDRVGESEPVSELGDKGRAAWARRLRRLIRRASEELPGKTHLSAALDDEGAPALLDWVAFPTRIESCLSRADALRLLDSRAAGAGRALQEEYLEWRVVRDRGRIRRVEMTTELAEYWRLLAAFQPARTLALVAAFAGEDAVSPEAVYGPLDPFAEGVSAAKRERAFRRRMLGSAPGPYNDGSRAICCMVQDSNSIAALIRLAAVATTPRVVRDLAGGHIRCLTCTEAFPFLGEAAMPARASDPLLVERLARLAFEGRRVAFDDAPGVYIHDVEHTRLVTPGGKAVPREWFTFSRAATPADGRPRYQRLVFEVPASERCELDDLVDLATEEPLRYGGQIADLVQLALVVRVSEPGALPAPREPVELLEVGEDTAGCRELRLLRERLPDPRSRAA